MEKEIKYTILAFSSIVCPICRGNSNEKTVSNSYLRNEGKNLLKCFFCQSNGKLNYLNEEGLQQIREKQIQHYRYISKVSTEVAMNPRTTKKIWIDFVQAVQRLEVYEKKLMK